MAEAGGSTRTHARRSTGDRGGAAATGVVERAPASTSIVAASRMVALRTSAIATIAIAFGAAIALPVPAVHAADDQAADDQAGIVIASGRRGGYYHAIARGLRIVLRSEHGIPTDVVTSNGSLENLAELHDPDSLVDLALAQADALQSYLAAHPDFADGYLQVSDAGKECAFIVARRGGGITGLDALAAPAGTGDGGGTGQAPRTIAIGEAGSGASVTWANMTRLRPALGATRAVERGVIETLLEMRQPQAGETPVAAMMVQRPMAVATPLEIVLQNREDFALVPIRESDLRAAALEQEPPVYSFEKVVVGFGRDHQTGVDTLCTRALLLASKTKMSAKELELVGRALLESRRYIMPDAR